MAESYLFRLWSGVPVEGEEGWHDYDELLAEDIFDTDDVYPALMSLLSMEMESLNVTVRQYIADMECPIILERLLIEGEEVVFEGDLRRLLRGLLEKSGNGHRASPWRGSGLSDLWQQVKEVKDGEH